MYNFHNHLLGLLGLQRHGAVWCQWEAQQLFERQVVLDGKRLEWIGGEGVEFAV